jgi:hypothetical protein
MGRESLKEVPILIGTHREIYYKVFSCFFCSEIIFY